MVLARFLTRGQPLSFARGKTFSRIALTHNLILCIGSLLMNVHVIWAITHLIHITSLPSSSSSFLQGLQHTFCVPRSSPNGLPTEVSFSLYIFLLSKVYELLDTFILVLRGRPLSLLHVWHHGSVMVEVWAWLEYDFAIGLYGMLFNTGVHVVMYAYYAATTLGVRSKLKSLITMTQIVQFLTGFASLVPFVFLHFGLGEVEGGCRGVPAAGVSAGINGSYLILFVLFYRQTYTKKVKEEGQGGGKKKQ